MSQADAVLGPPPLVQGEVDAKRLDDDIMRPVESFPTARWWTVVATAGVILAALYLLWAYQRVFHGEPDEDTGIIVHFDELDAAVAEARDALDHRMLNEVEGLQYPTLERIAMWLWDRLHNRLPGLVEIVERIVEI